MSCRTTGHGPLASPAAIETSLHLATDRATAIVGFASRAREVVVEVGGDRIVLRTRDEGGWRDLAEGELSVFSNDLTVRLTVIDGIATATVGYVRLTGEIGTDDAAGHARFDTVSLGAATDADEVRFVDPTFASGEAASAEAQLAA